MNYVFGGWRSKFRTSIDKNIRLVLRWQVHMYDHIGLAITGNVTKFQRNWRQVAARSQNIVGHDVAQSARLAAGNSLSALFGHAGYQVPWGATAWWGTARV